MGKMKIFISWSGQRSGAIAAALNEFLPVINNAFDPWFSPLSIDKGSRSTGEIGDALASAKAGIICLTPSNLTEPWILYEAGGIAKTVEKPLACTLLIDLKPTDVERPLGDFQHTKLDEKELLQLAQTLNKAAGTDARSEPQIEKAFKLCWPELKDRLDKAPADAPAHRAKRSELDLLEEILNTARTTSQQDASMLRLVIERVEDLSVMLQRMDPVTNFQTLAAMQHGVVMGYKDVGVTWVPDNKASGLLPLQRMAQEEKAQESSATPSEKTILQRAAEPREQAKPKKAV
jgi:hypothetical protein